MGEGFNAVDDGARRPSVGKQVFVFAHAPETDPVKLQSTLALPLVDDVVVGECTFVSSNATQYTFRALKETSGPFCDQRLRTQPPRGPCSWALLPLPTQTGTLFTKWLPTGSRAVVLTFDVVACIAVAVVVMNRLLHRVPRVLLRHVHALLYAPSGAIRVVSTNYLNAVRHKRRTKAVRLRAPFWNKSPRAARWIDRCQLPLWRATPA